MKKPAFTIAALFIMINCFTQSNNASQSMLDSVSHAVIHHFQVKQPDSIYAMAGEKFKAKVTLEYFRSICTNQLFPINNFQDVTFVKTDNNINKYKVAGSPELQLLIGLDNDNKIETLLLQPYSDN